MKTKYLCGCCNESLFELCKLPLQDRINGTENINMKNILQCDNIVDLDNESKKMIDLCVDFLLFCENITDYNVDFRNKYISIWRFIVDYLGIMKNSGYDYYLMMYLEWNLICEHGSGIRCAWFSKDESNPYYGRVLSEELKNEFIVWCNNLPNDF